MARMLTCSGNCGLKYERESFVYVGSKKFCSSCYEKYIHDKKLKEENKTYKCKGGCGGSYKIKDMVKQGRLNYCSKCHEKLVKDREDMAVLSATICRMYDLPYVHPGIKKQINTYRKYGFTLLGINETLLYLESLNRFTFNEKYGIGMVTYYYREAMAEKEKRDSRIFENNKTEIKSKELIVSTSKPEVVNELKRQMFIDMEELIND